MMYSVNDLRTSNEDTGLGVSNEEVLNISNPNIKRSSVTEESEDAPKRKIADLSSLPKAKPEGVNIVEGSLEDEIFKPDGEFENYLQEKKAEMEAVNDLIDQHNEMVAAMRGEEVPDNDSIDNININAVLAGTEFDRPGSKAEKKEVKSEYTFDDEPEMVEDKEAEYIFSDEPEMVEEPKEEKVVVPLEEQLQPKKTNADVVADSIKTFDSNKMIDFGVDEEDFEDLELEETKVEEEDDEANFKALQASISEKIKPVNSRLNISTFKIVKNPVSVSSASIAKQLEDFHVADWALMSSGAHIGMKEFSGKDIEKLGDTSGSNNFTIMKNRYKLFYDHLTEKPESLEKWLKSTSFLDNDHLYFALYLANFADANYIPYDCPNCKHTFLSDNIPMDKMYKLNTKEAEERFDKIRNSQIGVADGLYTSEIVPITNRFAIGFRDPSIYSIVLETSLLDEKFTTKYQDVISVISYIDDIYIIDQDTQTLTTVGYRVDTNNMAITAKSKILTYAKILSTFSPDQYNTLLAYMNAINTRSNDITYKKPEVTCPKCGYKIPEVDITAENLVFMRAQLAALSLTLIK